MGSTAFPEDSISLQQRPSFFREPGVRCSSYASSKCLGQGQSIP